MELQCQQLFHIFCLFSIYPVNHNRQHLHFTSLEILNDRNVQMLLSGQLFYFRRK